MHSDTIFHLIPQNDDTKGLLEHPDNRAFVSICAAVPRQSHAKDTAGDTRSLALEIGYHVPQHPRPQVIAQVGRNTDLILPAPSVSSVQFSFEVHPESRAIVFHDRSRYRNTTLSPLGFGAQEDVRQHVLQPGVMYMIGAGGEKGDLYLFEVRWVSKDSAAERALKGWQMAMERARNPRHARTIEEGPTDLASRYRTRLPTPANWGVQRITKVKFLGKGAYGEVWAAVDLDTGGWVAVKTIVSSNTRQDPKNVLWREVKIMVTIVHKNIVEYLGSSGWETGTVEIYTSLKDGNLNNMLQRFPAARSHDFILRSLLRQMLEALDFLAFRNLCHRDVKPDNILYTVINRQDCLFQLADFGLANQKDKARTMCGTPVFMAPEVFFGTHPHTPKVDVWSLFVTIVSVTRTAGFDENQISSYKEMLDLIRIAAGERPALAVMAHEDPSLRPSAAQLLIEWFNGEGLTTPRRLIAKTPTTEAASSHARADDPSDARAGVSSKREDVQLAYQEHLKGPKIIPPVVLPRAVANRKKRKAAIAACQRFT